MPASHTNTMQPLLISHLAIVSSIGAGRPRPCLRCGPAPAVCIRANSRRWSCRLMSARLMRWTMSDCPTTRRLRLPQQPSGRDGARPRTGSRTRWQDAWHATARGGSACSSAPAPREFCRPNRRTGHATRRPASLPGSSITSGPRTSPPSPAIVRQRLGSPGRPSWSPAPAHRLPRCSAMPRA